MEEKTNITKHNLTIEKRENFIASGIIDVLSFDEDSVIADTNEGVLIIKGQNLHINRLNLEKGDLLLEGRISSIVYEDSNSFTSAKGSFWGKLFK